MDLTKLTNSVEKILKRLSATKPSDWSVKVVADSTGGFEVIRKYKGRSQLHPSWYKSKEDADRAADKMLADCKRDLYIPE